MVPVPVPVRALGYTLVYALEGTDGIYLVDTGWNTEAGLTRLSDGLKVMGHELSDVRGVLVTHGHPDHYGLAARIRTLSGAWIGLHPAEATLTRGWSCGGAQRQFHFGRELLLQHGVEAREARILAAAALPGGDHEEPARPDRLIRDGDVIDLGGWQALALWTPGHSPGHLAFHLPHERILLSGDHVLPSLTPGVSYHPSLGPNPLGDFLRSLTKLSIQTVEMVLPAHERPFGGLIARIEDLRRHHEDQVGRVAAVLVAHPGTAWSIAQRVRWGKEWADLRPLRRRIALQVTLAALLVLSERGLAAPSDVAPYHWMTPNDSNGRETGPLRGESC